MEKTSFLFLLLLTGGITFYGCAKDKDSNTGTGGTTSLTKRQMLVKNTWKVDEVLSNSSNRNAHYLRGGENTTGANFDISRFTFNDNGTGTYKDTYGLTYNITWLFTTADEHNIKIMVASTTPLTLTWNLVEITENSLNNTTAVPASSGDILVSARYVPAL